jgi:hypothetical protein
MEPFNLGAMIQAVDNNRFPGMPLPVPQPAEEIKQEEAKDEEVKNDNPPAEEMHFGIPASVLRANDIDIEIMY